MVPHTIFVSLLFLSLVYLVDGLHGKVESHKLTDWSQS